MASHNDEVTRDNFSWRHLERDFFPGNGHDPDRRSVVHGFQPR